jgi:hypothetical protein
MKYLIEQINIGEAKSGEKNGKKYTYNRVGIKIKGAWYNASLFNQDVDKIRGKEGSEVDLTLYKEEYNGKMYDKFKFPTVMDKIDDILARIEKLERMVFDLDGPGGDEPKDEPPDDLPF